MDTTGGVGVDSLLKSLRIRGFRITVFTQSGESIPLRLSSRDPTDGTRLWILGRPKSEAVYFFVGTIEEVREFDKPTNEVYESNFSLDAYFRTRN